MRCTKCGKIINETMTVCPCGKNLSEIRAVLGNFYEPKKGFSWFDVEVSTKSTTNTKDIVKEIGDLSDLLREPISNQDDASQKLQKEKVVDLGEFGEIKIDEALEESLKKLKL